MILNFGDYLPDKPPQTNPGLSVATNCVPFDGYYSEVNDLVGYGTNTLSNLCRGAISCRDITGNTYSYAGDVGKLYRLVSSVWTDSTRGSGSYACANTDNWEFVQWGNFCVGTNGTDDIQEVTLGASTFAAVAGTPPKARHLDVVRDFIVLGNVTDYSSGASRPNRIHWCGYNNKDTWAPSAATQADFQDLNATYGWVQKVVGGELGIIFQERAITRMLYVGAPLIWQIDTVEPGRGTPAPGSVVKIGSHIFFLGDDDFYLFNGSSSQGIGDGRIFQTFKADYQSNYYYRITAAADPFNGLVYFAYPGSGSTGGVPNKIIVYNYKFNKWAGPVELNVEYLWNFGSEGYTLDGLDALYASLDTVPDSLDSKRWMGGSPNLAVFNNLHKLATFTGSPLTAVFETGEKQLTPGRRTHVSLARPMVDGISASASVAISSRNKNKDAVSWSANQATNSEGECMADVEARYHRFRITVADGFDQAYGIEIEGGLGGRY